MNIHPVPNPPFPVPSFVNRPRYDEFGDDMPPEAPPEIFDEDEDLDDIHPFIALAESVIE